MKINNYVILGLVILAIATIIGNLFIYIGSSKDTSDTINESGAQTVSEVNQNTNSEFEKLEENNEKRYDKILKKLGLTEKAEDILENVLGDNFKEILSNEESYNQLIQRLEGKTLNEIILENTILRKKVSKFEFIKIAETKNEIIDLISKYKYKSAREFIANYIKQNEDLKPEYLAELYDLKALTFSGNDIDHSKRKELLEKAMTLDENNPTILYHYGKLLNYSGQYQRASKILKNALDLAHIDNKMDPLVHVEILTILGSALFHIERDKPSMRRDFTLAKNYLDSAITINSKLSKENSQLYKIQRYLAEIEIETGRFDNAILLLNMAIQNEAKITGTNNSVFSAFVYMNLGLCYLFKVDENDVAYSKGMDAFETALKTFKMLEGENHIHVADVYSNMGALASKKDIDKAIELYKKSIEITLSYEIFDSRKLASSYANLARAYGKKSMRNEALNNANQALYYFRQTLPENHEEIEYLKGLIAHL